jgi:hypothetical protein
MGKKKKRRPLSPSMQARAARKIAPSSASADTEPGPLGALFGFEQVYWNGEEDPGVVTITFRVQEESAPSLPEEKLPWIRLRFLVKDLGPGGGGTRKLAAMPKWVKVDKRLEYLAGSPRLKDMMDWSAEKIISGGHGLPEDVLPIAQRRGKGGLLNGLSSWDN